LSANAWRRCASVTSGSGDVSDEFAALDSLDGLAFEDALATLKRTNPAAFARYEAR
jgi:hypothetical protein